MRLTAVRCKRCATIFPSDMENCPGCGRKGPGGWRNVLLKMLAVIAFLLTLALIVHAIIKSEGRF